MMYYIYENHNDIIKSNEISPYVVLTPDLIIKHFIKFFSQKLL